MKIATSLAAALLATAGLAAPAGAAPTAKLDAGVVQGAAVGSDLLVFRGIPYAAPPVGPLRWRAPQPVRAWTGVRPATAFGNACVQPHLSDDPWAQVGPQSEDCLFLNVWRPAKVAKGGDAVMVFIHGGSFTRGAAGVPLYDGAALARRGVVVVTINYRLGRFGFFAHPSLTAENADGMVANYGLMDSIAALKWVQRNVAAFGGDPKRVTVFGESAGAVAVQMLVASPVTKGLFARAIMESGGGAAVGAPLRGGPLTGEAFGVNWAKAVGLADQTPAGLRAASVKDVLSTAFQHGPLIDGVIATHSPGDAFRKGRQQPVGFMAGGNSHETSLLGLNTAAAKAALGEAYPAALEGIRARGASRAGAESDVVVQAIAIQPSRWLARRAAAIGQPGYAYYFDQVAASDRARKLGADHGDELSYLFGTRIDKEAWDDTDARVSKLMGDYWVRFAKTGDPNGDGAPRWAPITKTAAPLMVIDATPHAVQATALDDQIEAAAVATASKAWDAEK